jgi:hypothetical protein
MNAARVLYQMARADFLERVRRYSFLLTLAGALYLAYGVAAEKIWLVVGNGYRGIYNSAWIGALMSICCSMFLSLAGFYVVKNSVRRDSDTRVGQILAATPMRKDFYTLAKALSNFAVLGCMVVILMLAAVVMQLMRAEAHSFSLWKLSSPFVFFAFPTMFLTASVAILFETIPILRGGVGNIAYFFLWVTELVLSANSMDDPRGLQLLNHSAHNTLQSIDPTNAANFHFSLTIGGEHAARTFLWNGFNWTFDVLLMRLLWIAVGMCFILAASLFFHRFDPAREGFGRRVSHLARKSPDDGAQEVVSIGFSGSITAAHLTPVSRTTSRISPASRFVTLAISELRIMLKGQRWWWYLVAAGLLIAELASPLSAARSGVLIAAWIWPILLWSQMGCREARNATGPLLFSCERSLTRQLPALWTAGVALAAFTGGGVAVRFLLSGDWPGLAAWASAVVFIPSLALALGIWTGTNIPFEALYTVWWYIGPAHQTPGLDFMGTTFASSRPVLYGSFAIMLLAFSYVGRRARLAYA